MSADMTLHLGDGYTVSVGTGREHVWVQFANPDGSKVTVHPPVFAGSDGVSALAGSLRDVAAGLELVAGRMREADDAAEEGAS